MNFLVLAWGPDHYKNFDPLFVQIGVLVPDLWIFFQCSQFVVYFYWGIADKKLFSFLICPVFILLTCWDICLFEHYGFWDCIIVSIWRRFVFFCRSRETWQPRSKNKFTINFVNFVSFGSRSSYFAVTPSIFYSRDPKITKIRESRQPRGSRLPETLFGAYIAVTHGATAGRN